MHQDRETSMALHCCTRLTGGVMRGDGPEVNNHGYFVNISAYD